MEEVADARVVAITKDNFVFEVLTVVLQLFLDVRQARVKLIALSLARLLQRLIGGNSRQYACPFRTTLSLKIT